VKQHVPVLKQAEFEGAVWCASDGIVDIHALLSGYLKAAVSKGARVRYDCQVRAVRRGSNNEFEIALTVNR
jgi:glycine/D-amino acid oxidase-like deaminating enzyme